MFNDNNYRFKWKDLGNISLGRPNLGDFTSVTVYRLMEYTFRSVLNNEFGSQKTENIFFNAGKLAGSEFYKNIFIPQIDKNEFLAELQSKLSELKIGILRIEETDFSNLNFIVTISEDLDCSGLPITGETVCTYDEGFLCGVFESYFKIDFSVVEIDCWATGSRTCRFKINKK